MICLVFIILLIVSAVYMSVYQNYIYSTDILHCPYDLYISYTRGHLAFEILLILCVPLVIASFVATLVAVSTINDNRKKDAFTKMPQDIKEKYDKLCKDEEEAALNKSIEKTKNGWQKIKTK